ncbi:hypothetical protein [Celerinatantimonas sp. YJH-8]
MRHLGSPAVAQRMPGPQVKSGHGARIAPDCMVFHPGYDLRDTRDIHG